MASMNAMWSCFQVHVPKHGFEGQITGFLRPLLMHIDHGISVPSACHHPFQIDAPRLMRQDASNKLDQCNLHFKTPSTSAKDHNQVLQCCSPRQGREHPADFLLCRWLPVSRCGRCGLLLLHRRSKQVCPRDLHRQGLGCRCL